MLRFVMAPDGTLTGDMSGKLPGKAAWISANRNIINQAIEDGHFRREFGETLNIPDNLMDILLWAIDQRIDGTLGMLNRTGAIISGFEKVLAYVHKGQKIAAYITCAEADSDSRSKIQGKIDSSVNVIDQIPQDRLERILDKGNATHIIVKPGELCFKLQQQIELRALIIDA